MWLLVPASASALPELRLPAGEDPAVWADPAVLAGLQSGPGDDGVVEILVGEVWRVEATVGGRSRSVVIAPATTPGAREDALQLGVSLLRELERRPSVGVRVAAGPVYVTPRAGTGDGAGGELGFELRRGRLGAELRVRGTSSRSLGEDRWWVPVDVRLGGAWHSGGDWSFGGGPVVGLSTRGFGEGGDLLVIDMKPFAGVAGGVERSLGERWAVTAGVEADVDLGDTRIEAEGDPYALGLVEIAARVALVWIPR